MYTHFLPPPQVLTTIMYTLQTYLPCSSFTHNLSRLPDIGSTHPSKYGKNSCNVTQLPILLITSCRGCTMDSTHPVKLQSAKSNMASAKQHLKSSIPIYRGRQHLGPISSAFTCRSTYQQIWYHPKKVPIREVASDYRFILCKCE